MSDIFREVDEDLRHARYKALWDRFGIYVIGVAALIVVGTAAWRGYEYWQVQQAMASGDRFMAALELAESGDHTAAAAAFEALAADGSGAYPVLAKMRAASERELAGESEAAAAAFDAIAASSDTPDILQRVARLRAALILSDSLDLEAMRGRIGSIAAPGQTFRHTARDLLGMVAWRTEDYQAARELFTQVLEDEETPANLRQRAAFMLDLIDSRVGAPAEAAG